MAVTKAKKSEILSLLIENMKTSQSIGFTQTTGMTVADFSDLRKELRTVNTSYHLAKKTLVKIAVKEVFNLDLDLELIPGQIGVICSHSDSVAGLSKTNTYITKTFDKKAKTQKIAWAACIFEGKINGLEETKIIASMPSKETLLSRLVGSMQSPIAALTRFFDAISKELETTGKTKVSEIQKKESPATETE